MEPPTWCEVSLTSSENALCVRKLNVKQMKKQRWLYSGFPLSMRTSPKGEESRCRKQAALSFLVFLCLGTKQRSLRVRYGWKSNSSQSETGNT